MNARVVVRETRLVRDSHESVSYDFRTTSAITPLNSYLLAQFLARHAIDVQSLSLLLVPAARTRSRC